MVKTEYLRDAVGIRKFAVCASCGRKSTEDPGMVRFSIVRDHTDKPNSTVTAALCGNCYRLLKTV